MENITISDGTTILVKNARLNVFDREIVGIVGVNYSGKSVLVGGITGHYPYQEGQTYLNEKLIKITSIKQARKEGIFYIHKKCALIDSMTIEENIYLQSNGKKIISKSKNNIKVAEILDFFGIDEMPDAFVKDISYKNKIFIEIGKALLNNAKILILDSILEEFSQKGLGEIYNLLNIIKELHISIIIIEVGTKFVESICDRVFIMRERTTVAVLDKKELSEELVLPLMLGYPANEFDVGNVEEDIIHRDKILGLENIGDGKTLHGMSFDVFQNETVGILNINKHSGKAIVELLQGIEHYYTGNIIYRGKVIRLNSIEESVKKGIVVLPEEDGCFDDFTIEENVTFSALKKQSFGMDSGELKYLSGELISKYFSNVGQKIYPYSEVSQSRLIKKKIMLCRTLMTKPQVLIMINVTNSLDLISKQKIYEDIMGLRREKLTMMIISSDIDELLTLCSRIVVIYEGRVVENIINNQENRLDLLNQYGNHLKN